MLQILHIILSSFISLWLYLNVIRKTTYFILNILNFYTPHAFNSLDHAACWKFLLFYIFLFPIYSLLLFNIYFIFILKKISLISIVNVTYIRIFLFLVKKIFLIKESKSFFSTCQNYVINIWKVHTLKAWKFFIFNK